MNGLLDKITNSTEIIRVNRTLSYFSFIIKEMLTYTTQTARDIPYYLLREALLKINQLKVVDENLRIII